MILCSVDFGMGNRNNNYSSILIANEVKVSAIHKRY